MRISLIAAMAFLSFGVPTQSRSVQPEVAEKPEAPVLSIIPVKEAYSVGEEIEFEIRIDNVTGREVCFPAALGKENGFVTFMVESPSGMKIIDSVEGFPKSINGDTDNIVCLKPGSFYGVRERRPPLKRPGNWQFKATYWGPQNEQFPKLYTENISSEPVMVFVNDGLLPILPRNDRLSLYLDLEEFSIARYGIVVGKLFVKNIGSETFRGKHFSVVACNVVFDIERPDGNSIEVSGYPMFHHNSRERVELEPGEYLVRPISMMRKDGEYFFEQPGLYRIVATYKYWKDKSVVSNTAEIKVQDSKDEELGRFLEVTGSKYGNIITPFRGSEIVPEILIHIDEFEDYKYELAKIAIYQSGGQVVGRLLGRRGEKENIEIIAREHLDRARKYGYGIEMWEYLLEKTKYPETIRVRKHGYVYPKNEFYF